MHDGLRDLLRARSTIWAVHETGSRLRILCPQAQAHLAQYCELLGPQVLGAVVFYKTSHEVDPPNVLQLICQAGLAEHEHLAQLPRHECQNLWEPQQTGFAGAPKGSIQV